MADPSPVTEKVEKKKKAKHKKETRKKKKSKKSATDELKTSKSAVRIVSLFVDIVYIPWLDTLWRQLVSLGHYGNVGWVYERVQSRNY